MVNDYFIPTYCILPKKCVVKEISLSKWWIRDVHAASLGIQDDIVYQERMEQKYLSGVYRLADFFLLPTEYEIFGMVLLEAMYYKTVVLTTNNGGSSTLIENSRNGYILENKKASEWAKIVSETPIEEINAMKNAAHDTIDNHYT